MLVELAPNQEHIKIALSNRNKAKRIKLASKRVPLPQPFEGKTFVITGNIIERKEKPRINQEKLKEIIERCGEKVFEGDFTKAAEADFILITSQKEL